MTQNKGAEQVQLLSLLRQKLYVKAQEDLHTFVKVMAPMILPEGDFVDGRHIRLLCKELMAVERGDVTRLMIFLSPGSTKSKLCSVLFPAWYYGRHASRYILGVSHSVELAEKFSAEIRDLIESPIYKDIFPETKISKEKRAVKRWQTTVKGEYLAAGAGKQIAGFRGHVGIIDDAVSEQTAYSKTERTKINDWYAPGFRTRILPGGAVIIINTRWHLNDLSGFLLSLADENARADQWKVIRIPAILDHESAELLGLEEGGSYWPEYWPLDTLLDTKESTPAPKWNALYMQTPTSEEGTIFNPKWFSDWEKDKPPKCEYILMSADTAFKDNQRSDYSAITIWGVYRKSSHLTDGREVLIPQLVLLYAVKGRWQFPDLCKMVQGLYDKWQPDGVMIEDKASGQSLIQEMRRRGFPILVYSSKDSKELRAHAITPHVQSGYVWVPKRKAWCDEFITEVCSFPYAEHDDYVDTMTQAVQYLRDNWAIEHPDDQKAEPQRKSRKRKSYWSNLVA